MNTPLNFAPPRRAALAALPTLLLLGACSTMPTGPSIMALPGSGKSFEQFRADDYECRQYAELQTGTSTNAAAENSGLKSAAVGTAVGALAGAAIGGRGAAGLGAGTGLAVGALAGSNAAQGAARGTQRHYDNADVQCMYAKGEKVPVSGNFSQSSGSELSHVPAPPPPPPPGYR